ncbi:hypothetical protein KFU94_25910 [Chloroflexi bacterium TSY]|nr:hypothetical protein [Chloroflexi bacterium TSY]
MYDTLTYAELKTIVTETHGICVSIYMPTNSTHLEMQEKEIIRLRNLLDEAESTLRITAPNLRTPDIEQLLAPAKRLLYEERIIWQQRDAGLAIFLAPNFSRVLRLPLPTEALVVVGHQFHIKPLLPLLTENTNFYILTLSQKAVHLFQGDRFNIHERELTDVPHSLAEALQWDDFERTLQWHSGDGRAAAGGRVAIFHGQGIGSKEMHKENLQRFLQQIAVGVKKTLNGEKAPLVLAGVDYVLAMYRQLNQYPHLVDEVLAGNPDECSAQALHDRAWPFIKSLLDHKQKQQIVIDSWPQQAKHLTLCVQS